MGRVATKETHSLTVRIPSAVYDDLEREAKQLGFAVSTLVGEVVEDHVTSWHSAPTDVALFEADAKALAMTRSQYWQHVMALRRNQLIREGAGFEKKALKR